jgi:hypothetical protein
MMDATARGPFLPVYASSRVHWAEPFLKRLSEQVKLVGPTISCQPVQSNPKSELPKRDNPYVQVREGGSRQHGAPDAAQACSRAAHVQRRQAAQSATSSAAG